jgi:hypothetical protein
MPLDISQGTCKHPRMDDSDRIELEILTMTAHSSYDMIKNLCKLAEEYEKALDGFSEGANKLATTLDKQVDDRTRRIRLSILVGAIAFFASILAFWNSSSVGVGFHQILLIALGGALITFCLVELILNKIVEIPSKQAKANRELANIYKSYVEKFPGISSQYSAGGRQVIEGANMLLAQMKKNGYSAEP